MTNRACGDLGGDARGGAHEGLEVLAGMDASDRADQTIARARAQRGADVGAAAAGREPRQIDRVVKRLDLAVLAASAKDVRRRRPRCKRPDRPSPSRSRPARRTPTLVRPACCRDSEARAAGGAARAASPPSSSTSMLVWMRSAPMSARQPRDRRPSRAPASPDTAHRSGGQAAAQDRQRRDVNARAQRLVARDLRAVRRAARRAPRARAGSARASSVRRLSSGPLTSCENGFR